MTFFVMTSCLVIQIPFKFLKINFLIAVTHEYMYTPHTSSNTIFDRIRFGRLMAVSLYLIAIALLSASNKIA